MCRRKSIMQNFWGACSSCSCSSVWTGSRWKLHHRTKAYCITVKPLTWFLHRFHGLKKNTTWHFVSRVMYDISLVGLGPFCTSLPGICRLYYLTNYSHGCFDLGFGRSWRMTASMHTGPTWMMLVPPLLEWAMVATSLSIFGVMELNIQRVAKAFWSLAVVLSSMATTPTFFHCSCAEKNLIENDCPFDFEFICELKWFPFQKIFIWPIPCPPWGCKHWFWYHVGIPEACPSTACTCSSPPQDLQTSKCRSGTWPCMSINCCG